MAEGPLHVKMCLAMSAKYINGTVNKKNYGEISREWFVQQLQYKNIHNSRLQHSGVEDHFFVYVPEYMNKIFTGRWAGQSFALCQSSCSKKSSSFFHAIMHCWNGHETPTEIDRYKFNAFCTLALYVNE
jgi:hypothetical protein